jgi:signal transduction histidine kinase
VLIVNSESLNPSGDTSDRSRLPDLSVLIVEDSEDDMLLMLRELRRGGYAVDALRVDTPEMMRDALDQRTWDVVIADYTLPAFSAPAALQLLQNHEQRDLPFIIVSGTIGEETAVAAMKAGAHDYLTKGNLARLVPAVEREIREAEERRKRHQAEQALRESEARMRQLEAQLLRAQRMESMGTLASGVAHDFNNILTPILAAAQLLPLKLTNLEDRDRYLLQLIEDSAKRGADLVKQILAFARGVEGKRVSLQVGHLLAETAQIARQTFPKTIDIQTDIPTTTTWLVSADATQLHQVFMNLCINARDAMAYGGRLSLSLENTIVDDAYSQINLEARAGAYVVITVTDQGMGIAPEFLDRIFDPFFTTKEVGKGTGLGLSMVLGIVKSHGGFVTVKSAMGQGTQFKIYLPAVEASLASDVEELPPLVGRGELILVVDDEDLIRQVTQTSLEEYDYRVMVAIDGAAAIAAYAQHQGEVSAVLMDIMMPSVDGITAIRTLQKLNPQVKVIATSGLVANSQLSEEISTAVKAFLPKPFTAKELLSTLQQVLAM